MTLEDARIETTGATCQFPSFSTERVQLAFIVSAASNGFVLPLRSGRLSKSHSKQNTESEN